MPLAAAKLGATTPQTWPFTSWRPCCCLASCGERCCCPACAKRGRGRHAAGPRRRAAVGRPSAPHRVGDLCCPTGRVSDGAVLPADILLFYPRRNVSLPSPGTDRRLVGRGDDLVRRGDLGLSAGHGHQGSDGLRSACGLVVRPHFCGRLLPRLLAATARSLRGLGWHLGDVGRIDNRPAPGRAPRSFLGGRFHLVVLSLHPAGRDSALPSAVVLAFGALPRLRLARGSNRCGGGPARDCRDRLGPVDAMGLSEAAGVGAAGRLGSSPFSPRRPASCRWARRPSSIACTCPWRRW